MKVQKFGKNDAQFVRSAGQDRDIEVANLVDDRHSGPVTIGYAFSGMDGIDAKPK